MQQACPSKENRSRTPASRAASARYIVVIISFYLPTNLEAQKRCVHELDFAAEDAGSLQDSVSPTKQGTVASLPGETPKVSPSETRLQLPLPSPQENRGPTRFIGDLNPEHLLVEATSPHSSRDLSIRGGIGIWQSQQNHDMRGPITSAPSRPGPTQTMHSILRPYVHEYCLTCLPPVQDWYALRNIYFEKSDPLYPVMGWDLTDTSETSPSAIIVKQAVCLAAATNPEAAPFLRLQPHTILLNRSSFTTSLSAAIHATIDSGLVTDRVLLIRVLLLYSMYMQPTCPEEADLPTAIFARASQQMITLGFHLPMDEKAAEYESTRTIFLCTWVLDRLNAAFYGRACIIHERDVGWDFDECIRQQPPPFRLFLMVTRLLEGVFSLYRPTQKVAEEPLYIDMPILEQLIIDADATKVASPLLGKSVDPRRLCRFANPPFKLLSRSSTMPWPFFLAGFHNGPMIRPFPHGLQTVEDHCLPTE
jgi:hypothetical protein